MVHAQSKERNSILLHDIDSINQEITDLQAQIPKLQEGRSLSYYNIKKKLDQMLFLKSYTEYVYNEELDKAKILTEERLERSKLWKDEESSAFYVDYKKKIYEEIRLQKIRYQQLFSKEKNFRKTIKPFIVEKTAESLDHAKRMTELAIKYASENQFTETVKFLKNYNKELDALIYDLNSPFDLEIVANNENYFEKEFRPLTGSDSLKDIKSAEELVNSCICYCALTNCLIDTTFFNNKKKYIANALAEYYEKLGGTHGLEQMTDQAVVAKLDSVNPTGVYKWHGKILVINEFTPKYSSHSLKKGEAIIESDKKLINYIRDQEIMKVKGEYKIQGTYFIPFKNGAQTEEFIYNFNTKKWQYMLCYTNINNAYLTNEISKYMPPLIFREEEKSESK